MSAFKEQLAKDLTDVFLNVDEFGDEHTINGVTVKVVVDNDELQQRSDKSGIDLGETLFFVRVGDMPVKPAVNKELRFDGKIMFIRSFMEDDGLYEITLAQNRSM